MGSDDTGLPRPYDEVDPVEARAAADAGAVLVDVREHGEWQLGHAPGAQHIPLGELPSRLDELPADARIIFVCRSGNRSGQATAWLTQQGHRHADAVANMRGGMAAWARSGLPVVAPGGGPGGVA
jgi:rhodanese-related sulfurtransferase